MVGKEILIKIGKRKMSIAKGVLRPGTGVVRVNKMNIEAYGSEFEKFKLQEPLIIAGADVVNKVNIEVTVNGGGWQSQVEAARIAISKLLVEHTKSKELEDKFNEYDRHLLVADTRRTEPQKPYRSAARRTRQISKR